MRLSTEDQEALAAALKHWRRNGPAVFAAEALGATPTAQQLQAGEALVKRRRLSIRSGHGTGKSAFLSWCVLWFLSCFAPAKIPCTAPTAHQLNDVLWSEIARWLKRYRERMPHLGDEITWAGERVYLTSRPAESFAVARTARPENPEALQGFHSPNLLFLIDEASGVPERVFEVAEGALSTHGAFVVLAANPTREEGYFYDSHHKDRARWATLHWPSTDSTLVSTDYVESMRAKYGEDSAVFKTRVLGDFCAASDGLIPLSICLDAQSRDVEPIVTAPRVWGLDVARFGDDSTCLAKRWGNRQESPCEEWWGMDTMQTVGRVRQAFDEAKSQGVAPDQINVDVIGIGAGVVDRLREQRLPVAGINVAESPSISGRYMRLRDELWYKSREWLMARDCALADDDELISELTTVKFRVESSGKIKVEGKDELKKRGVKSPNRADAWNLTFAAAPAHRREEKRIVQRHLGAGGWMI